jgi:MSHA biogenesis protein MshI
MGFFSKKKKLAGWTSLAFLPEGLCVAQVTPAVGGRPVVARASLYQVQPTNADALEKLAKDWHMANYTCTTLLAASQYHMLVVEAPNVPAEELKTAIRWRIKDLLDYHIDDATVDVLDIPPDPNAPTRNHSMYAVAAPNAVISERQAVFERAHVPVSVIDVPEMAQRNIAKLVEAAGRGLAILAFSSEGGLLTVTFDGELYLSRRIDISVQQLSQGSDDQQMVFFDRIALELQRSLDHFDRQFHYIAISKLMLAAFPTVANLQSYLASNLYVPVELLELDRVFDLSKTPELNQRDQQPVFFHALGAALRVEERAL